MLQVSLIAVGSLLIGLADAKPQRPKPILQYRYWLVTGDRKAMESRHNLLHGHDAEEAFRAF